MDKVIGILKKPARWIVFGGLCGVNLFGLLYAIGFMANFGNGINVIGALLYIVVLTGLCGATGYAILTKKGNIASALGKLLIGFYLVSSLLGFIGGLGNDAAGVLHFIALFFLLATFGVCLLNIVFPKFAQNKILKIVAFGGVAAFVLFELVSLLIGFGGAGDWGDMAWVMVVGNLESIAMLPALLFGYLLLAVNEEDFKFQRAPKAQPEQKEEEPVEEEPVGEEPAEEPTEEKPAEEPKAENPDEGK
ncbi:MAG: hypothetical protein K6E59_02680 [Bacilli bacterium]|nr:hypothetical protein [Bacilli bacterium]